MRHLETQVKQPWWTFGGGAVLMLHIDSRQSKDLDLFVPDPQYLGYLNRSPERRCRDHGGL